MLRLLDWFNEKTSVAKSLVNDVSSHINATAAEVSSIANFIYQQSSAVITFSECKQFWQGFTLPSNPNILLGFLGSKKTQRIAGHSLYSNVVCYFGSALTYEVLKSLWRKAIPDMENSYSEWGLDGLAAWYFAFLSLRMIIDNTSYNSCNAKAVSEDNPLPKEFSYSSESGIVAIARATLASPFYYFSNFIFAKFFEKMLPYGEYLALPLFALAYGLCFIEYLLGSTSTEERYKILSANNFFALGLGTCFLFCDFLFKTTFRYTTDNENSYIEKAFFYMLFQYFIMTTLLIDKPLPGKGEGLDVFYYGRFMMETILRDISKKVIPALKNPKPTFSWQAIWEKLETAKSVFWLKKALLYRDQQTLAAFVKSPAIELYLDICGDDIQNIFDWLIYLRKQEVIKRPAYVLAYLPPKILRKRRDLVEIVRYLVQRKFDGVFEWINDGITSARLKMRIHDKKYEQRFALPEPILATESEAPQMKPSEPEAPQPPPGNNPAPADRLPELIDIEDYPPLKNDKQVTKVEEDWEMVAATPNVGLQQNSIFAQVVRRMPQHLPRQKESDSLAHNFFKLAQKGGRQLRSQWQSRIRPEFH